MSKVVGCSIFKGTGHILYVVYMYMANGSSSINLNFTCLFPQMNTHEVQSSIFLISHHGSHIEKNYLWPLLSHFSTKCNNICLFCCGMLHIQGMAATFENYEGCICMFKSATTKEDINKRCDMIMGDWQLTTPHSASTVGISQEIVENILRNELGTTKASTCCVCNHGWDLGSPPSASDLTTVKKVDTSNISKKKVKSVLSAGDGFGFMELQRSSTGGLPPERSHH